MIVILSKCESFLPAELDTNASSRDGELWLRCDIYYLELFDGS